MAKKMKRQEFTQRGFEIFNDAQRATAEAQAKEGWSDDKDIVVDPAFAASLRARIERLREFVGIPPELSYKNVLRIRLLYARNEFTKKGPRIKKALAAARALCSAIEDLGAAPNVYWSDHHDVTLFLKVIGELPNLHRLCDELDALTAKTRNFKGKPGRPRDFEKAVYQRTMIMLLPDRMQRSGRRMDKEFTELYKLVSGRKQEAESYNRTRRATGAYAHNDLSRYRTKVGKKPR
jgi:hypothetical protein